LENDRLDLSALGDEEPVSFLVPVPELTRSAGIQLNELVSLRHHLDALSVLHRTPPRSGPTVAKPSGDHIPLGGFVFSRIARSDMRRTAIKAAFLAITIAAMGGWLWLIFVGARWIIRFFLE
jgi:hypothetical protein